MAKVNIIVRGTGSPLVLCHGWGFDAHIWFSLLPELTDHYQLHLVDLPGFGSTPLMDWNEFKASLLAQLPTNFALAGWSMGGLYATRLAIEAPLRVSRLLNIASSPYFIKQDDWSGVDPYVFESFYKALSINLDGTYRQFINAQLQGQTTSIAKPAEVVNERALYDGLDVLLTWDLREELAYLTVPVLYLFGRLDGIMPRKTMVIMQRIYPQFDYILMTKAAHVPFLSHPTEFITILKGFME